jgi:hypothetical protein
MRVHTSSSSLLRAQVERFRKFEGTVTELHEEMVAAGVADHKELTSGSIPTETFIALGHPLGRTGAGRMRGISDLARQALKFRGSVPLLPINRQTGDLQESLKVEGPIGSDKRYIVGFTAPYAPFVLSPTGTRLMVPRGFFQELERRNKARLHGQLLRARDMQRRS